MNDKGMNLYDQIVALYRTGIEWNYYDTNINKPFNKDKARDFIKQYFENGAKKKVILPLIDEIESMRHVHTVSAFFVGLLIKRELCPNLIVYSQEYEDYEFSYLWFLVCLFHDMGYAIENDWTYKHIYRQNAKEYLKKYKQVKGSCVRQRYEYEDLGLIFAAPSRYKSAFSVRGRDNYVKPFEGIRFSNGVTIYNALYSRKTVLDYLEYCKMTDGIRHYDHGIVGGLWLYDSLMKNYHIAYWKEKEKDKNVNFKDFLVDGYWHFSEEQKMIFAYLADCIIAHNMWPASPDKIDMYKRCGLDELTPPRFRKISFERNPILFILAIADTIEPIKLYLSVSQMSEVDIWKGIDIFFSKEYIRIKILDNRLSFESLLCKVNGLDDWLDVKVVTDNEQREVTIYLCRCS